MKVWYNLILAFCALSLLSACAASNHSQTAARRSSTPPPAADNTEAISFIDGIALERDGHETTHHVRKYESSVPAPESSRGAATRLERKYADMMDVPVSDIRDTALYAFIDSWWGTPYRYGGESRSGIDCSAFVQMLYATVFGIGALPRTAEEQYRDSRKIKHIHKLKEGDLVFFRIHSRHISHVGIYLDNNKFVHASFSSGVMISDLTDPYWTRYFAGGGEPIEVAGSDGPLLTQTP